MRDDVIYLAPVNSQTPILRHPMFGCVATPDERRPVPTGTFWGADCGLRVAKSTDRADIERYLDWLECLPYDRTHCLYAVAPDVLGDAAATWQRSAPLLPLLRGLGYRAALVAQDGFDGGVIDWDAFDVLFIGGSPLAAGGKYRLAGRRHQTGREWKRREDGGYAAIAEGKRRGKWIHVGRVNGGPFLRSVASAGADSADGSLLSYAPDHFWRRITGWLDGMAAQPPMSLEAS
jgi:hypothetical protein